MDMRKRSNTNSGSLNEEYENGKKVDKKQKKLKEFMEDETDD